MPRPLRTSLGGVVYHVLNRANGRTPLFEDEGDYAAFERILAEAQERISVRVAAYCLMPNHWHMVLWPRRDGELSEFVHWLTLTHVRRWHAHRRSDGSGHVYQGRFKSFPIQDDAHFLTVVRYVERNALRARLVERAEQWRWCSLWQRTTGTGEMKYLLPFSAWPVQPPANWPVVVNRAENPQDLDAVRRCVVRGRPCGAGRWLTRTVARLGLESTLRPRGRPQATRAAPRGAN